MRPSRIPLPAPLRSTPVTTLRRYYERSDSCAGGSSARASMNTVLIPAQGSLRPVPCRHDHSVPTHLTCPGVAFARYPSAPTGFPRLCGSRFRHLDAGSSLTPGRIGFVSLRTGHSPSIAPHLASRRRSYRWVRAGERMPGEDLHLSVMAPLQAHARWRFAPARRHDDTTKPLRVTSTDAARWRRRASRGGRSEDRGNHKPSP